MHAGPCLSRVLNARLWNLEFSQKARDLISGLGRQGRGPSGRGQGSKQEAEEVPRPEAAGPYKNSGGSREPGPLEPQTHCLGISGGFSCPQVSSGLTV